GDRGQAESPPLPAPLRHRTVRVTDATPGAGLPRRGPMRSAMLGALHRDDARARRRRPEAPPSPSRAAARAPRRARAAGPRMRFVPTLSVEWSAGGLRFRLEVPEADLAEPLLEEVRPLPAAASARLRPRPRALVIGSDPRGDLRFVGQEVEAICEALEPIADIECVSGRLATFDAVTAYLGQSFDLIHYCGHLVASA